MGEKVDGSQHQVRQGGAVTAGLGGGTILVLVANQLPPNNPLRPWLLLAAPTITMALTALWAYMLVRIQNFLRDKEAVALIEAQTQDLLKALNNDKTSVEHKEKMRQQLEQLEQLTAERRLKRLRALELIVDPEPQPARPRGGG